MRIAFDYQIFSLQAYGGISRYYVRLADALAIAGNDVGIFAPLHCNEYMSQLPAGVVNGRKVDGGLSKLLRFSHPINRLAASLSLRKYKPDLLHETYFSSDGMGGHNLPVVLTVYDMVHELFPSEFSRFGAARHKRRAIQRADHIICISENTRQDLIYFFDVDPQKVSVVYLGVDPAKAYGSGQVSTGQKPYILFVGQRAGYKNFHCLVRAFSMSERLKADYNLVCFGGGVFTSAEQGTLYDLGISAGVVHVGGSDSDLASVYANASAFVYPSKYEGFGLPPLEAMAYGCPVVVSHSSSMPEVVGDAGEYFTPDCPEHLLASLEGVLFDDERRSSLIACGKERLKRFTWQGCAADTLSVYEKVRG
ncbi:glycosyltransferase family 4 protein [Pseudomonas stutzeri]|uniref:glycosyltransferase family 4 protein n=1 Tax=Stutzerimonas stutzeri TaxID=316 RepID=UPI00210BF6DA|nr:glycosyltransferase family 1 protein [Stutzerimonas stutzeri]MCQ4312601.1 glycosyltransferase family 4 protein [Stutzerimonas stutzeri]